MARLYRDRRGDGCRLAGLRLTWPGGKGRREAAVAVAK
eukprot:gene30244-40193_t